MTTTSTMCGLGSDEKPTSRVLRPPGGGSSDIFGTAPQNPTPTRQQNRAASNIFGTDDETASPKGCQSGKQPPISNVFGAEEHKIYGKGRNQSKFNPITGEPYDDAESPAAAAPVAEKKQPQQQDETASPSVGASAQDGQGDGGNFQAAPGKARPTVHTSSRVLNPPGGRSQKLW